MSRLDELIQELCPDGVNSYPLMKIAHYATERIPSSQVDETTYVGVENLLQNKQGKTDASSVPTEGVVIGYKSGDILIGNIRPYLRKIWLANIDGGTNGDVLVIQINDRKTLMPEYLYYILSSESFFQYDTQYSKGAKMPRGSKDAVMQYSVPVPHIEVQREIVRILDNFTELSAELSARKLQYEYYRDQMLSFDSSVQHKRIQDICAISRGRVISKEDLRINAGDYPVYSSQTENNGEFGRINSFMYDGEYLTWTTDGANAGSVFYRKGKFSITNVCGLLKVDPSIADIRYLFHSLKVEAPKHVNSGMGNPKLMSNVMGGITIALPSMERQKRIAKVLDNFESICSDLNIGLPAEIEG